MSEQPREIFTGDLKEGMTVRPKSAKTAAEREPFTVESVELSLSGHNQIKIKAVGNPVAFTKTIRAKWLVIAESDGANTSPPPVTIMEPVLEEGTAMPARQKKDDSQPTPTNREEARESAILSVQDITDRIRIVDRSKEDAAELIEELAKQAESRILELPTKDRTALRKAVKDAREFVPGNAVAKVHEGVVSQPDDFSEFEGVPEAIAEGVRVARKAAETGSRVMSLGEELANVMLNIRQRITNSKTGLPDLTAVEYKTKRASSIVYEKAREGIAEDDVIMQGVHNSIQRATQNQMSNVLVGWIRAYDTTDGTEALAEMFPGAIELMKADETLTPSEAVYRLYESKGVSLPRRSKLELDREKRAKQALVKAHKELTTAKAAAETGDEKAAEEARKLEERVNELTSKIAPEALPEVKEPTPEEVSAAKVDKAVGIITRMLDVTGDDLSALKDKRKAAVKRMTPTEKAALKVRLTKHIAFLSEEAAEL